MLAEHAVAAEQSPSIRSAEVAVAGHVQQLRAATDQLTTVLAQVEQRQRELSAAHDGISRDRQHQAAVTDDAAAALAPSDR